MVGDHRARAEIAQESNLGERQQARAIGGGGRDPTSQTG